MSRRGAIAIFVKTPGESPVKTRLAHVMGAQAAVRFHQLAARATAGVVQDFLSGHRGWQACFAVAERQAVEAACWRTFPAVWCGTGGLGERMFRVARTLCRAAGAAILIGADTPQLRMSHLALAAAALRERPWVLGPASDGGFWLLGTRVEIPLAVWQAPDYEQRSGQVRSDLVAAAIHAGIGPPVEVAMLTDVDRPSDLSAALEEWPSGDEEHAEQLMLRRWCETQSMNPK